MRSLCGFLTLLLSCVFVVEAESGVNPSPETGTIFAVYPGWDMDNGSVQNTFNGTESACLHSCASSSSCVAFAYVPYGNVAGVDGSPICVFKSTIGLTTFKIQPYDVSIGIVGACGTFNPVGPTSCHTVPL